MKLLNRSALMLIPRQPYVDWVNSLPADISELEQPLERQQLTAEGRVYLIDEYEAEQSLVPVIERYGLALLKNELGAWDEFAEHWPDPLANELISQWFELRLLPLAFDAESGPLMAAVL